MIISNVLKREVLPELGKYPLSDIKPPMILEVLRDIEKCSTDKAHRIRTYISTIFQYGIALGYCEYDPAAQLQKILKPYEPKKRPAITNLDEFCKMMFVLDNFPAKLVTHYALKFLALTALRSGELRSLSWEDLDGDVLRVPASKMKMKREHVVPLACQSMEILEAVRPFTYNADFIFPSPTSKRKRMSDMTLSNILKRCGYAGKHVPHGFRSSFSSIMNERRPQDRYIIDLMLAHINRDNVEAAYNRAEHLEKRREIAQEWADLIC